MASTIAFSPVCFSVEDKEYSLKCLEFYKSAYSPYININFTTLGGLPVTASLFMSELRLKVNTQLKRSSQMGRQWYWTYAKL